MEIRSYHYVYERFGIGFFVFLSMMFGIFMLYLQYSRAQDDPLPPTNWTRFCDFSIEGARGSCGGTVFEMEFVPGEGLRPLGPSSQYSLRSPNGQNNRVHAATGKITIELKGLNHPGEGNAEYIGRLVKLPRSNHLNEDFYTAFTRKVGVELPSSTDDEFDDRLGPRVGNERFEQFNNTVYTEGLICAEKGFGGVQFDDSWHRITQQWQQFPQEGGGARVEITTIIEDIDDSGNPARELRRITTHENDVHATNYQPKLNLFFQLGSEGEIFGSKVGNGFYHESSDIIYRKYSIQLSGAPDFFRTPTACDPKFEASPYEFLSCADPSITEDKPFEPKLEVEDPPPLYLEGDVSKSNLSEVFPRVRGAIQDPLVRPRPQPFSPLPKQDVTVFAEHRFFATSMQNVYTTWCLNGVSQQGLVAGGELITETVPGSPVGSCCNMVTRTPAVDTDNDGMDDDWERFHFFGKPLYDCHGNLVVANIDSLDQVKPEDDFDCDGYYATDFRKTEAPFRGRAVTIAPNSISSTGVINITGDGKFTNLEEYIWGTDPTNSDTDGDGEVDEADIVGRGQHMFTYQASDKMLARDEIRATAVGFAEKKLVKIDSFAREVTVGKGEALTIELSTDQPLAPHDRPVNIRADVMSASKAVAGVHFEWTINGHAVPDQYNGEGKQILPVTRDLIARVDPEFTDERDRYIVGVAVNDRINQQFVKRGSVEKQFIIGDSIILDSDHGCGAPHPLDPSISTPCVVRNSRITMYLTDVSGPHLERFGFNALLRGSEVQWYLDGRLAKKERALDVDGEAIFPAFTFDVSQPSGRAHTVRADLHGNDGIQYASQTVEIPVLAPRVRVLQERNLDERGYFTPRDGDRVVITAQPEHFQEAAPGDVIYSYDWNMPPGLTVEHDVQIANNQFSFTALHPGRLYQVSVSIDAEPSSTSGLRAESASRVFYVKVRPDVTESSMTSSLSANRSYVFAQSREWIGSLAVSLREFIRNVMR
jgi:hypothetical protein